MPATAFQGQDFANAPQVEAKSLTLSTDIKAHATKAITVTPYEKIDYKGEPLTLPYSQSRQIYRKTKSGFMARARETDFAFLKQLYFMMQQPVNAWLQMADATWLSFIKNGTSQATQAVGNATGTNLIVPHWKFFCDDNDRYIDINGMTEMTPAEAKKFNDSRAAALVGAAVQMKSAGVQATSTNGLGSTQIPGWNQYASVQAINSGGTAIMGNLSSGTFTLEAGNVAKINDNMPLYDRVIVDIKFLFENVGINDWKAAQSTMLESAEFDFNFANSDVVKCVNCIQVNSQFNAGSTSYDIEVSGHGHIMANPNDAATAPLPNIDFDLTSGANVLTLNLTNN